MNRLINDTSDVSVVIVSFNTVNKLRRCLGCIESEHEVIVVDNGSHDGSVEMVLTEFPAVRLIQNEANVGFGAANNIGSHHATRPWILYLNSDAYAETGAIALLADSAKGAVAAGGRLLNIDGSLQQSVAGPLTLKAVFWEQTLLEKLFPRYWQTPADTEMVEVEQVMGACLLVRAGLETFDERFFLYCEDTDLCIRLRRHGKIVYCPNARFMHELGSSSSSNRWLGIARYNRGKELYFQIHATMLQSRLCWVTNRLGALLRLIGWILYPATSRHSWERKKNQCGIFWNVLKAKSRNLDPR